MLGLDNILYLSKTLLSPSEESLCTGKRLDDVSDSPTETSDSEMQKVLGLSDHDLQVIQSKMGNIVER